MNSIPVIGTAIVSNPRWLKRLIDSVDYPTENFVIINNNGRGQINSELDEMVKIPHPFIKNIKVSHMPANIGCSGAWNMIIKCYLMLPYWIITNDDIAFTPGFLEKMVSLSQDPDVGMVHGSGGDFNDGGYDLFLIKDWVVQKFGLFDENCYPAYCEDVDYIMKLRSNPIKKIPTVGISYFHGDGMNDNYYTSGQQTKKGEGEDFSNRLNEINLINWEYMTKKWGEGWRLTNPYSSPYNKTDIPISYTSYDLEYLRRKYLGF